ncbi:protein of unknown function [Burkholderia multivorans]
MREVRRTVTQRHRAVWDCGSQANVSGVSFDELGESGDFLWLTVSLDAEHATYSDPRCGWHGERAHGLHASC